MMEAVKNVEFSNYFSADQSQNSSKAQNPARAKQPGAEAKEKSLYHKTINLMELRTDGKPAKAKFIKGKRNS